LLFEYLSLLALVIVALVPDFREYAQYFLAGSLLTSSTMFYLLITNSIIGLQTVDINTDIDLNYTWQTRVIVTLSAVVVYLSGFSEVFFYVLPFLLIGSITDVTATLLITGFIELEEAEDEEEEPPEETEETDKQDK
jgi:hypothetical protein